MDLINYTKQFSIESPAIMVGFVGKFITKSKSKKESYYWYDYYFNTYAKSPDNKRFWKDFEAWAFEYNKLLEGDEVLVSVEVEGDIRMWNVVSRRAITSICNQLEAESKDLNNKARK